VLEKPVRFQQTPFEAFKARLLENGMSEAFAQAYVDMMVARNESLDNAEPTDGITVVRPQIFSVGVSGR
jgi:hypothetical protein